MPQAIGAYILENIFAYTAEEAAAAGLLATAIGEVVLVGASVAYSTYAANQAKKALRNSFADQGRDVMSRDPIADQRLIYGQIKTTGTIIFMGLSGPNNIYLHVVVVLAGHECDSISEVYLQ